MIFHARDSVLLLCIIALTGFGQTLDNDTLIIGSATGYPGQQVVIPVYMSTSVDYQGWQIPLRLYGADTSKMRIDSVSLVAPDTSCMKRIPKPWDFIAPFKNNKEWDGMMSCGVAGVVDFSSQVAIRPGYYIVMHIFVSIDYDAANGTTAIDTTTSRWTASGPLNSYRVTVGGSSYVTPVRSGGLTVTRRILEDTLIIGDVLAYPGQSNVRVPVYSRVAVYPYDGWQIPLELYDTDTTVIRMDSFAMANSIHYNHPIVGTWDFIADFINNQDWDNMMSCGVAGIVSFMTGDSVPLGYHLVGEICATIDPGATPQTIVIDTTTSRWSATGPAQAYMVTVNGQTWYTQVKSGSIKIQRNIVDDTLIVGDNAVVWVDPGDVCTLSVYMKNTKYYQGMQVPVEFFPYSADSAALNLALELDSTAMQNSVMYDTPDQWDFIAPFDNNYEWDNAVQGGVAGIVWISPPPESLPPGTWTVCEYHFRINSDARPQTIIVDSTAARWTSGGPLNRYIVTMGGMSWKTATRPCTLSIGGHLWNDTLIIGNVVGYPGDTVRVPVYMKNAATGIGSWNIPFSFGDGSMPVICDSINYLAKDPTWNYFMLSLLGIDNSNQNCVYGGFGFSANPPGFHKILELKMIIDEDASPQVIVIDTTTTSSWGSYSVNSTRITNVIPGSITIKGKLPNDTLIVIDRMIHPGTHVDVPLYLRSTVDITTWQIPLVYGDGSSPVVLDSISFIGAWPFFSCSKYIDDAAQKCAIDGLAWPSPNGPGYHLVGTLHFYCLPTAPLSSITIDTTTHDFGLDAAMSYNIMSDGTDYTTIVRPGHLYIIIGTEENEERAIPYQGVYPTVVRAGSPMSITWSAPTACRIRIRMYDVVGRYVTQIYDGSPDRGILDMSFRTVNLPAGIYFVRIESDEKETVHKVIITK